MKFLHTSDWHLGKIFYEHSLMEDQKYFLDQMMQELSKAESQGAAYDALIVAGDIYDKAIASPDAVTLFSDFLSKIHEKFPKLEMFFSSGNHDSASRLSFASELLHSQRIHLATKAGDCDRGIPVGEGDDAAIVYQVPFLQMGALTGEDGTVLRHQDELVAEACRRIKAAHDGNKMPCVVSAHVFAGSATLSGGERNFVGTAEQVDAGHFKDFDYVALGHIHGKQKAGGEKVRYCGSPLAYSFGEKSDKVMLSVNVTKDGVDVREISISPLHKVTRREGTYEDFISGDYGDCRDDYLELVCTDNLVHENPLENLRGRFPNLLSFRVVRSEASGQNMAMAERRKALENIASGDYGKLFNLFMNDVYREKIDDVDPSLLKEEQKIFTKTAKEAEAGKE